MNPREYVSSLKGPSKDVDASNLPDSLVEELQNLGFTEDELVITVRGDFAELLLERLAPRLPANLADLFSTGVIAVGTIDEPAPNVYLKKIGGEGYAIVFHSGLKDFIYRVARILATRFVAAPASEEHPGETIKFEETARIIADIFWWAKETSRAAGPTGYPINKDQLYIANQLALEAETFLLAHEIGHILDDQSNDIRARFGIDTSVPVTHRDEYIADAFGLRMVMEVHNLKADRHPFNTPMEYAGAEFALQVFRAFETLGFDVADSHPSAANRLQRIRSEMKSMCDSESSWKQLSSVALGLEAVFDNLIKIIQDPREHEEFFDREARSIISELDDLLTACSGGAVPDYSSFYEGAGGIFNRGYSHQILERAGQIANDFFLDDLSRKQGVSSNAASWTHFQKFKLLFGYTSQQMREPARSVFLEALRMAARQTNPEL